MTTFINTTKDSRTKSLSEAFVNSFGGYPIGYGIGIVILPLSMGWLQEDVFTANIFITLVYATVSFLRIYYLRRIFERLGFDDNFIRLGIKLAIRIRNSVFHNKNKRIIDGQVDHTLENEKDIKS